MEAPKFNKAIVGAGGGRPSKGQIVLRRGLGVTQLGKLRRQEEQHIVVVNAPLRNSPYNLHIQLPNVPRNIQPSSLNSLSSSTISLTNSVGSKAFVHDVLDQGHTSRPRLWGPHEFEFQKKNFGVNPRLAFASSLPCDFNPFRPLHNWIQRTQQQQQQQHPSSSMVNVSLITSSSTTTPHSSIIKHPSNQNHSGNYVSKRQEDKMIGFKRPNPFSLDIPPLSSSISTTLTAPAPMKANGTISWRNGRRFNMDFTNSTLWEIPPLSACNKELILKKSKKKNKSCLTFASPTRCSNSKFKSFSTSLSLQHQGNMKDQVPTTSRRIEFNHQQQHWYNCIPSAANVAQIEKQSNRFQNCNAEGEIDLSLKL